LVVLKVIVPPASTLPTALKVMAPVVVMFPEYCALPPAVTDKLLSGVPAPITPEAIKFDEELVVNDEPPFTVLLKVIAPEDEVKILFPVKVIAPV
jgi:hypothetical protein